MARGNRTRLALFTLTALSFHIQAANWAQTTGPQSQNVIISAIPGESYPHWTGREGMAIAISNVTDDGRPRIGNRPQLFVLGGDDHTSSYGSNGSPVDTEGGGGLRNDVWYTEAQPWSRYPDVDGDVTDFNEPVPRVRSRMKWTRKTSGRLPPAGVTYKEWVQCQDSIQGLRPGVKSLGIPPSQDLCDDPLIEPRQWVLDNMWSPRRYHQAAMYKEYIILVGGEARELEDLPHESAIGGIQDPRIEQDPFHSSWREKLVLKNDVWVSADGGSKWKLANPGCDDPQSELIPEWTITRSNLERPSTDSIAVTTKASSNCQSDNDCYGSARCRSSDPRLNEREAQDAEEQRGQGDADGEGGPIGMHSTVGLDPFAPFICVCEIFSPRKHHRMIVYDGRLYLIGGFTYTTQQSFCGKLETSRNPYESWENYDKYQHQPKAYTCGAQHRVALNDIWYTDLDVDDIGTTWLRAKVYKKDDIGWEARGSFALAKMKLHGDVALQPTFRQAGMSPNGTMCLWIIGGEGLAEQEGLAANWDPKFFNDMWFFILDHDDPDRSLLMGSEYWHSYNLTETAWAPRAGHVVAVEPAIPENNDQDRMYIHGGHNEGGVLGDVWSWGSVCETSMKPFQTNGYDEEKRCTKKQMTTQWVEDYTADSWYRMMTKTEEGSCQLFSSGEPPDYCWIKNRHITHTHATGPKNPVQYYVDGDSPLANLNKVYLPGTIYSGDGKVSIKHDDDVSMHGVEPVLIPLVTPDQLEMLEEVGLHTVSDLAHAHILKILKLRGFDYPEVEDRMEFPEVCDLKALAEAILQKCDVDVNLANFDGEELLPQNIDMQGKWHETFRDGVPHVVNSKWYGQDFTYDPTVEEPVAADIAQGCGESIENCTWDGCFPVGTVSVRTSINVFGLGDVDQVQAIRDPYRELQELHCKWNPGARYNHVGAYFDNKFYVMGGRDGYDSYRQDSWYRDDRLPVTALRVYPKSWTSDTVFRVKSDEEGCQHEYRLYNNKENVEIRRWNRFMDKIDLLWLAGENPDWESRESTGQYVIYVRSIDPAGNVDPTYDSYAPRNMYAWYYQAPDPGLLITVIVLGCVFLMLVAYAEYRRRKRKAAMQRYAIKRMRRKFKQAQKKKGGKRGKGDSDDEDGGRKKKKKKKKKKKDKDGKERKKGSKKGSRKVDEGDRKKKKATGGKPKSAKGKDRDRDRKSKQKDKDRQKSSRSGGSSKAKDKEKQKMKDKKRKTK